MSLLVLPLQTMGPPLLPLLTPHTVDSLLLLWMSSDQVSRQLIAPAVTHDLASALS